jgi:hypothetical protein
MDDELLRAALRVLNSIAHHDEPSPDDIAIVRANCDGDSHADLDDLATEVIQSELVIRKRAR